MQLIQINENDCESESNVKFQRAGIKEKLHVTHTEDILQMTFCWFC